MTPGTAAGAHPVHEAPPGTNPAPVIPLRTPPARRPRRIWLVGGGLVLVLLILLATPFVRWRVNTLFLTMTGRIPDMEVRELIPLLLPGAGQPQIARLAETRNPYAVVHIPDTSAAAVAAGGRLFRDQCAGCHSPDGSGGPGAPALFGRDFKHGGTDWAIYRTIRDGVPNTGMPPHPLKSSQLWQLAAFIRSFGVRDDGMRTPEVVSGLASTVRLPYKALVATRNPGADWLTFSGTYTSTRHSELQQIDTNNVGALALRWMYQFEGGPDRIESSPVVRNGILFVTAPLGRVFALDAATGRQLWTHEHPFVIKGGGEGPLGQNRGVALLGDRVFVGTWDSKLTALSAATGQVLWETTVGEYPGTYISGAPLVFQDLVVVGIGSPPGFGRGFIAAYDVNTGRERWRFQTVPGPGEKGHDTWAGDSWRKGGAGSWVTGSYDPQTDTLYWGIGNPRPDFETTARKGDNLYSDSVVALRGTTGQLLWYFQFTPGDDHDWDSSQVPLIADQGEHKRLVWANRNGFYYVLDRETGRFVRGIPFVRQNWARGLDGNGRPIRESFAGAGVQGVAVYPGAKGGTNWWPPSYDPTHDLVFIPVLEQGMVFFPSAKTLPTSSGSFYTAVRALNASTGQLVWERRHDPRAADPNSSGLLSTEGGLVFGGDRGTFFALDETTGKILWSLETGGSLFAAPVTYAVRGQQFVSVIAGRNLLTFALPGVRPAD